MRKLFTTLTVLLCLSYGLAQDIHNVPASGNYSITTCNGLIYDNGGPNNNYLNNSNGFLTIKSGQKGKILKIAFTDVNFESCCDRIYVYQGESTSDNYTEITKNTIVYSNNQDTTLTVRFNSDGSVTRSGFKAFVSCVDDIPQTDIENLYTSANPEEIVQGQSFYVTAEAINNGIFIDSLNLAFYLSNDNILDSGDSILSTRNSYGNVSQGETFTAIADITLPDTLEGKFYIFSKADYNDKLSEDNEDNNVSMDSIIIHKRNVDLSISFSLSNSSYDLYKGQSKHINVDIQNRGNARLNNVSYGLYLSKDTSLNTDDIKLSESSIYSLSRNSGSTKSLNISPLEYEAIKDSIYYLIAMIDNDSSFSETSETNNIALAETFIYTPKIDASIESLHVEQDSIFDSTMVNLSLSVKNNYSSELRYFHFMYYLSDDDKLSNEDQYLGSNHIYRLYSFSEDSINFSFSFTNPENFEGEKYILVKMTSGSFNDSDTTNNFIAHPIKITQEYVNFENQQIQLNSDSFIAGSKFEVQVDNNFLSNKKYYNLSYQLVLSSDTILDQTDQIIQDTTVDGNNYHLIIDEFNSNIHVGKYYLLYKIDARNEYDEINENDNIGIDSLHIIEDTLTLKPELILTNADYQYYNNSLFISYSVQNLGSYTPNYTAVGIYGSYDTILDFGDPLIEYGWNIHLNKGEFLSASEYISGSYHYPYYIVRADYKNQNNEYNKYNNLKVVRPVRSIIQSNEPNKIIQNVINNTTKYDFGNIYSYSSFFQYPVEGDSLKTFYQLIPLSTLENDTINLGSFSVRLLPDSNRVQDILNIPDTLSYGLYELQINYWYLDSLNNDTIKQKITSPLAIKKPDYNVQTDSVNLIQSVILQNEILRWKEYMSNSGLTVTNRLTNNIYISQDSTLNSDSDSLIHSHYYTILPGSKFISSNINYSPQEPGKFFFICETPTDTVIIPFNVKESLADLEFGSSYISGSQFIKNTGFEVNYEIKNTGTLNAPVTYYKILISEDTIFSDDDVIIKSNIVSSINAGNSLNQSVSLSIPNVDTGNYHVIILLDSKFELNEFNEDNNTLMFPIEIVPTSRNFEITQLTLSSETSYSGDDLNGSFTVKNGGLVYENKIMYRVYLSKDTIIDIINDAVLETNYYYTSLYPQQEKSISFQVQMPMGMDTSDYQIFVQLDYNNIIEESDETDNVNYVGFRIGTPNIDLSWSGPNKYSAEFMQNVYMDAYISNSGNSRAANFSIKAYVSQDSVLSEDDLYIYGRTIYSLSDGSNYRISNSFYIDTNYTVGRNYIIYVADRQNTIKETNENNNTLIIPLDISESEIDLSPRDFNATVYTDYLRVYGYIDNLAPENANYNTLEIYYSQDSSLNNTDQLLKKLNLGRVYGNSYDYVGTNIYMRTDTLNGYFFIKCQANDIQTDINPENNQTSFFVSAIPPENTDLSLSINVTKYEEYSGDDADFQYSIYGKGTHSDIHVMFHLSEDYFKDHSDDIILDSVIIRNYQNGYSSGTINIASHYLQSFDGRILIGEIYYPYDTNRTNNIAAEPITRTMESYADIELDISNTNHIINTSSNDIVFDYAIRNHSREYIDSVMLEIVALKDGIDEIYSDSLLIFQHIVFDSEINGKYELDMPEEIIKGDSIILNANVKIYNHNLIDNNEVNNSDFDIMIIRQNDPVSDNNQYDLKAEITSIEYTDDRQEDDLRINYLIQNDGIDSTGNFNVFLSVYLDEVLYFDTIITNNVNLSQNDQLLNSLLCPISNENKIENEITLELLVSSIESHSLEDTSNNSDTKTYYLMRVTDFSTQFDKTAEIYPNPFNDQLIIHVEEEIILVKIFNLQGKLVYVNSMPNKQKFKLNHLPAGMYLLNVYTNSGSFVKQIIKN